MLNIGNIQKILILPLKSAVFKNWFCRNFSYFYWIFDTKILHFVDDGDLGAEGVEAFC